MNIFIATLMMITPINPAPPMPYPFNTDQVERTSCLWMGEWICPEGVTPPKNHLP